MLFRYAIVKTELAQSLREVRSTKNFGFNAGYRFTSIYLDSDYVRTHSIICRIFRVLLVTAFSF